MQKWKVSEFKNYIKGLIDYWYLFKSFLSLKFWLKNILSLWSWGLIPKLTETEEEGVNSHLVDTEETTAHKVGSYNDQLKPKHIHVSYVHRNKM